MATIFFSIVYLSLFLSDIFLISTPANARYTNDPLPSPRVDISPKDRAARPIRSLDLFSQEDINIVKDNSSDIDAPRLVEKKIKFPFLPVSDPSVEDLRHYAGYYHLPHTLGARMFYFFFESRNQNNNNEDPVVIWLSGGPGISCSIALFYENGPFHIKEALSLIWNDHGWDKISNIIYVDQPIGTGFSYTIDDSDIRHDLTSIIKDLYNFLKAFFIKHTKLTRKKFFITGQSYAGHYAPALASKILEENEKINIDNRINLQGLAIGNGHINPYIQSPTIPVFAWIHKLIRELDYSNIEENFMKICQSSAKSCEMLNTKMFLIDLFCCSLVDGVRKDCPIAFDDCLDMITRIRERAGNKNFADIRKERVNHLNYDFSEMETFLNKQSLKDALGVYEKPFVAISDSLLKAYSKEDYMKNSDVEICALLDKGIKVLIYAGDQDLIGNWRGIMELVLEMEWSGKKEFKEAPIVPFEVDDADAGAMMIHDPLSFVRVYNAGAMVPMDQPKVSFQLIQTWMQGELN
ncbi:serine carboxypeptidase-like 47 [Tripterygium wilfordii]|uniref:serine carboxypeptidase-like 47 n=1 Tax=Tripterygium wilfordii TaxID=458696 RepID=UPI0018F7FF3E|nr:serine carboxypeptidase-like 47 [Tripterygium wilfordii]